MADGAKGRKRVKVEAVPEPAATTSGETSHEPVACPVAWCPVCLAVTAVQPLKPEVVEHFLKSGSEFFLALRSLIDARADEVAGGTRGDQDGDDGRLHKIDIG
jgi:hypothetical protein